MVEQALHLLLKGIIQASFKVAGAAGQLRAVHENVSFREGLLQEHLDILAALLNFLLLGITNRPVLGNTTGGAAAQIILNLQHRAQLVIQAGVIMQQHKNRVVAAFTGRKHLQAVLVCVIAARSDDLDGNGVVRAGEGIVFVNLAVEAEGVSAVQIGIAILVRAVVLIEDQRSQLTVHLGIFNLTLCDFTVDFLLLVGQENVVITEVLHQLLLHQFFQGNLNALFQLVAVLVHPGGHQRCNVLHSGSLKLLNIFNHEQDFENFDLEASFLVIWVQIIVPQSVGNCNGGFVVNQCRNSLIERTEGNQNAFFLVLDSFGSAQIHTQHRTLTIGAVLAGAAEQANRIQYFTQQVKLIGYKRIYVRKICRAFVKFHFRHITGEFDDSV